MTRRRARILLLLGSVAFALAATEVGLRVAASRLFIDSFIVPDPVLGWSLPPGYAGWATDENRLWVQINSAGWRDRERSLQAAPNTARVTLIGDSFVHAYFVPLEKTFASFLEQGLTACISETRRQAEVLSFGVLGYGTTQELLTYRYHASRYSPNIVALSFFTQNDIYDNSAALSTEPSPRYVLRGDELILDNSFRAGLPDPPKWPLRRRMFEYLTAHSRAVWLLNWGQSNLREYVNGPEASVELPNGRDRAQLDTEIYRPPVAPEVVQAWKVTEALLLKFAEEVAANGSEFWIVTLSNNHQVDPDLANRRALEASLGVDSLFYADRRVSSFAAAHGIRVVSLAEPLADYTAANGTYLNGGYTRALPLGQGHWNDVGNRVAAEITARQMCAQSQALGAGQPH